ncbi:hypothetical protein [Achromobacter pestifer]
MSALSNVAGALVGWKGYAAAALVGVVVLAAAGAWVRWYGWAQFEAGAVAKQAEIEKRQAAIERAWQEERDRADAKHRGAVLAREAAERTVADQRGRIDGLLLQLAKRRPEAASAGGGLDATGPDWIGIIGSCVGRYEQLGKDAARWADQVNGLQGYIRALGR